MFLRSCVQTRSLFSKIYFGALLFIILVTGCIFFNLSLHSITLKKQANTIHPLEVHRELRSNSSSPSLNLLSVREETEKNYLNESRHQQVSSNQSSEAAAANPISQKRNTDEPSTEAKAVNPIKQKVSTNELPDGGLQKFSSDRSQEKENVEWIVKKYPNIEMLKSTELTKQFRNRAQNFFDRGCEVRFFMTWISPATSFGKKEFLALQSVFKYNPNGCLMILSRSMDSDEGKKILSPLTARGFKVTALTPDLKFLFKNTPAKAWFDDMKKGLKNPGQIPFAQNLSNLLRLVTLYKYGGVYLDTDFIVLKSFSGLRNSIGAQSVDIQTKQWNRLNNAVLVFDKNHPLLYKFIENFCRNFDGSRWGFNGPYLVSRVIQEVSGKPGYNFTVLPPMAFYPVDWLKIGGFFQKPVTLYQSKWVDAKVLQLSRETYGVHLWNKESGKLRIEEGSVIRQLISRSCLICENIYSS
ncbi:hypothetical protein C5167_047175 [Papaver somniferum]|uniref:Alpha 1,4-glycosyltransferase domain-containing protein n=1 Tax=Papaver somniferum TaxID=3469 RepID=A0A4Y7LIS9_PAPSO|nr:lactosylceramide 4-alpha-galactosyltransferase-like [Papaver somniferum]RZC84388.1 hypothetical protein C5167_047175 [Papaver somniferum]